MSARTPASRRPVDAKAENPIRRPQACRLPWVDTCEPPSVTGETSARGELGRLDGGQLAAISNALVGLHRRYYGRGATKAKAYQVNDDLILVELRDAYLTVERTLIQRGQAETVRRTRLTFQRAMFDEFLDAIEQVTGRKVSEYVSESITDLD